MNNLIVNYYHVTNTRIINEIVGMEYSVVVTMLITMLALSPFALIKFKHEYYRAENYSHTSLFSFPVIMYT